MSRWAFTGPPQTGTLEPFMKRQRVAEASPSVAATPAPKRGRGRPRKVLQSTEPPEPMDVDQPTELQPADQLTEQQTERPKPADQQVDHPTEQQTEQPKSEVAQSQDSPEHVHSTTQLYVPDGVIRIPMPVREVQMPRAKPAMLEVDPRRVYRAPWPRGVE